MCGMCRESDLIMKIKTFELKGKALDYAVAIAKGVPSSDILIAHNRIYRRCRDEDGNLTGSYQTGPEFLFHKMWEAAGPIIEREGISLKFLESADTKSRWVAKQKPSLRNVKPAGAYGQTALEAAVRCYVSSKLGPEVEIPGELL